MAKCLQSSIFGVVAIAERTVEPAVPMLYVVVYTIKAPLKFT